MAFMTDSSADLWIVSDPRRRPLDSSSLQLLFSEGDTLTISPLPPPPSNSGTYFDLQIALDATKGRFQFQNSAHQPGSSPTGHGSTLSVRTPPVHTTISSTSSTSPPFVTVRAASGTDIWSEMNISFVATPTTLSPTPSLTAGRGKVGMVNTQQQASEIESLSDLHSKSTELLINSLPKNSSRVTSPADLLRHSRLVTPRRGTLLTTDHHPNQPLWFVLCGQLTGRSFDPSLEESLPATSGDLLNCEGLLGAPALMEWKVDSDSCCLLEIDRSFLSLPTP